MLAFAEEEGKSGGENAEERGEERGERINGNALSALRSFFIAHSQMSLAENTFCLVFTTP